MDMMQAAKVSAYLDNQTFAKRRNLMRVGVIWPVRLRRSSSYSEKLPSNQVTLESSSKAKICVAIRSRNQL